MCACASVKVSAEVKGVGAPGDGVTDGCESLMLVLGAKHGSFEKNSECFYLPGHHLSSMTAALPNAPVTWK